MPGLDLRVRSPRDLKAAFDKAKKERDTRKKNKYRDDLIDRLKNPKLPDFKYDLGDLNLTPSEEKEVEESRADEPMGQAQPSNEIKERKDYKLPVPYFKYNIKTGLIDVVLYSPKSKDFDEYIFDISRDPEFSQIHHDSDGEIVKNKRSDKQSATSKFDKEILCKEYTTIVYGSAAIRIDGKVNDKSHSETAKFKVPALNMKSAADRKKMCGYQETTTVTDQVDQDRTAPETENRFAPEDELTKKVKVKFDVKVNRPIDGKDAEVLKPALNWAFDLTRDLVNLLPNIDKDQQEDIYEKTKDSRDDLVDRIQDAYPGKWPGFKKIFVDLRESVEVTADVTPDEANDTNLDDAANGLFDVNFDYTLMLRLAKKVNWREIPTYAPSVIQEVAEQEEEAEAEAQEEAETPVDRLTTIADVEIPEVALEVEPLDEIEELILEEDEVSTEQEETIDEIQTEVDENLVDNINNLWDYSYEYEIPEFDFTVCQRNYDPVADGTFIDLAYDSSNIESLAAHCLKANNIIGGYPDGTFRKDKEVNRAEAAKFLMVSKFINIDNVMAEFNMEPFVEKFPDVPAGQWYTEFVTVANRTGVIKGYSDGTYKPGNTVNTAEFFKMLLAANPTNLSDSQLDFLQYEYESPLVDSGQWYSPYFYVVDKENLLESREGHEVSIDPSAPMTRGEVAVAIFKYLRDVTPDSELLIRR